MVYFYCISHYLFVIMMEAFSRLIEKVGGGGGGGGRALQEKSELETDTYPSLNRDGLHTN